MLLLGDILISIRLEAGQDELYDLRADDACLTVIFLPVSRNRLTFTVFLDCLSRNTKLMSDCPLGHSLYCQLSYLFIHFHFNNHLPHLL